MNDLSLLKREAAFQKLFLLFKKKYESLGRIGGSVSLKTFSKSELASISGLTGISDEELQAKKTISLMKFEKALQQTRYQYESLLSFLEAYFNEILVPNKERQIIEEKRELKAAAELKLQFQCISWYIDWISKKSSDSRMIWNLYKEEFSKLKRYLSLLENAYVSILKEKSFIRLPLFAQKITGNPHAFDRSELLGKMLIHLLTVDQIIKGVEVSFSKTSEEENDLLGIYGLLRDDLWSFVTCQNLIAEYESSIHPVWRTAQETGTVLNLPLKELIKVDTIYPFVGETVWVVENSSVASTLMDTIPNAPIICTHGQLRIAGWRMIELLAASNTKIYYSGDLDPEGLMIADRIKRRYPAAVQFWRMDKETYLNCLSEEQVSENRINKLNGIESEELQKLTGILKERKMAAYQEAMIKELVEDIKSQLE